MSKIAKDKLRDTALTLEVTYTYVETGSKEDECKLNRAFDVLFEEVLKNRGKTNPQLTFDINRQLRIY